MKHLKLILILIGFGLGLYWVLPSNKVSARNDLAESKDVVYLCRETKQLVQAPPQPTPAMNPNTGRLTLFRALYCGECKRWHAVPPPDLYPGNPLTYRCPKHDCQMTASGPLAGH